MRGVVDASSVRYLPWIDKTAMVVCDLVDVDSGAPVEVSPRRILQVQADKAEAAGYVPMIGSEIEFFLFKESFDEAHPRGYRGLTPNSPYLEDYHILQTTKEEDVLGAMRRALVGAGMPLEFSKGEAGRGQHELNLTYQRAVEMADINLVFKNAVKEIAHSFGKSATFMAKPHFGDAGSSCHIHSSLWSIDGQALMPTAGDDHSGHDPHHMSQLFRWYLGGLMATTREFTLLFAPTVNSYKRFLPGSWAPTAIGGTSTTGRSAFGSSATTTACGSRAASLVPTPTATTPLRPQSPEGSYGIAHQIEPPPPYHGNGYAATDLTRHPPDIAEAIELWRNSEMAVECFGDDVHHHVLVHAEAEWLAFNQTVTEWERARYFERI